MKFLTEDRVRKRAKQKQARVQKSASQRIAEEALAASGEDHFDIFLSHSSSDAELVDGVRLELEDKGYSVYVDWLVDPQLDRSRVSAVTADNLRARMQQCDTLVYMHTTNSAGSKWMPWELGYFDGHSQGRVSVLPVVTRVSKEYKEQEYLGLYPVVDFAESKMNKIEEIWVNASDEKYTTFQAWRRNPQVL